MENRKPYPRFAELFKKTQQSLGITNELMANHLMVDVSQVKKYQGGSRGPDELTLFLIAATFTQHWANRAVPGDPAEADQERHDRQRGMAQYFWNAHSKLVLAKTEDIACARYAATRL